MKREQLQHLSLDQIRDLPAATPAFVIAPGRYYLAHYFASIPPIKSLCPFGADLTGLLWCFADKMGQPWHITFRQGYYCDDSGEQHYMPEKSMWFRWTSGDSREALVDSTREMLSLPTEEHLKRGRSAVWHWLDIDGDHEKYHEVIRAEKPSWLCLQNDERLVSP